MVSLQEREVLEWLYLLIRLIEVMVSMQQQQKLLADILLGISLDDMIYYSSILQHR